MKWIRLTPVFTILFLLGFAAAAVESRGPGGGAENGMLKTERHFYLLQPDALGKRIKGDDAAKRAGAIANIAAQNADTFVIDSFFADSPSAAGLFTSTELDLIRSGGQASSGRTRVILAYISIGEAESYRSYWNAAWDRRRDGKPDEGAPSWLLSQNREWKGNYRVKYWDATWQALILGSAEAELDRVITQGFDGVYLDIVDGFETFEKGSDNAQNLETNQTYRRDMVDFVKKIAAYGNTKKPGFLTVPQNGTQLLEFDDYVTAISGQGQEDLYFNGSKRQDPAETGSISARLKKLTALGKAALVTDYPKTKKKQTEDIEKAQADGFSIFIAPRALNGLGRIP